MTDPVIRGNSLYTLVNGPTWTQAEANAQKLGGHLADITSESENLFLLNNLTWTPPSTTGGAFAEGGLAYWVGLNDAITEGSYNWSSGAHFLYDNRDTPGSDTPYEDWFTLMHFEDPTNGQHGKWNDIDLYNNHWSVSVGIAETPIVTRGDSAYAIVQGPSWEEAEANAQKLGGHLVTINDAAENGWIKQTFNSELFGGNNNDAWIGLRRQNISDSFSWADGLSIGYSNWYPGEPNGSSQPGPYATNYGGMWLGAQSIGHLT